MGRVALEEIEYFHGGERKGEDGSKEPTPERENEEEKRNGEWEISNDRLPGGARASIDERDYPESHEAFSDRLAIVE